MGFEEKVEGSTLPWNYDGRSAEVFCKLPIVPWRVQSTSDKVLTFPFRINFIEWVHLSHNYKLIITQNFSTKIVYHSIFVLSLPSLYWLAEAM